MIGLQQPTVKQQLMYQLPSFSAEELTTSVNELIKIVRQYQLLSNLYDISVIVSTWNKETKPLQPEYGQFGFRKWQEAELDEIRTLIDYRFRPAQIAKLFRCSETDILLLLHKL